MVYGYFCEDTALEVFVDETLRLLFNKHKCEKHEEFFASIGVAVEGNDKTIDRNFVDVSKRAQLYKLDLFIIGRDYDNRPLGKPYDDFITFKRNQLNIRIRNRAAFCVPIKCTEYWLYYVKHQRDENAPESGSIESNPDFNGHKIKADVYQGKLDEDEKYVKQSREKETEKAKDILKNLDIKKLRNLSHSFDNFIKQLKAVNL